MTKQDAQKWANALRSGKYEQTTGRLQSLNIEKSFCCLGVACDLFIPENKKQKYDYGQLIGSLPNQQDHAPVWLKKLNTLFGARVGIELAVLNDEKGYSFDEIADLIELVYVHKALP